MSSCWACSSSGSTAGSRRYARARRSSSRPTRSRAGANADAEAAGLRDELDAGADPATLGDPFLRGRELRLHSQPELAGIFGPQFAAAVMQLPENVWSPPIRSTFGAHVVRVAEKKPGTAPGLSTIR